MKTLEEHNDEARETYQMLGLPKRNGIACPRCGEELVDSAPNVMLSSFPPQKRTNCSVCEYTGYRVF